MNNKKSWRDCIQRARDKLVIFLECIHRPRSAPLLTVLSSIRRQFAAAPHPSRPPPLFLSPALPYIHFPVLPRAFLFLSRARSLRGSCCINECLCNETEACARKQARPARQSRAYREIICRRYYPGAGGLAFNKRLEGARPIWRGSLVFPRSPLDIHKSEIMSSTYTPRPDECNHCSRRIFRLGA